MDLLKRVGEWIVLLPLWRRLIKGDDKNGWRVAAAVATGLVWVLFIVAAASGSGSSDSDTDGEESVAGVTASNESSETDEAEETDEPTPTPEPTNTPEPTATPLPTQAAAAPIDLSGVGQTATETITPPGLISIVTLTHTGTSNFIVSSFRGGSENLLVNEIGNYTGSRPMFDVEPAFFDVSADGAWTMHIEAAPTVDTPVFSGTSDAASGLFFPASQDAAPWQIAHDGTSNFIVTLHCADGSDLIQNEIGPVDASTVVSLGEGPCLWEVEADGNWSLAPR